ncbi:hypothetical protein D3C77_641020 [compost metagenome]
MFQCHPARGSGQAGGALALQLRAVALGEGHQQRILRERLLAWPASQQLCLELCVMAGFAGSAILLLQHGEQHQEQGGGEGDGVKGPKLVFE